MNAPSIRLAKSFLIPAWALTAAGLIAGLPEAMDYAGPWDSGSTPVPGHGDPTNSPGSWRDQLAMTLDGIDALELYLTPAVERSWISTTISGPTMLFFSYRGESFLYMAGLSLWVGTSIESLISAGANTDLSTPWREHAVEIPPGETHVMWNLGRLRGSSARAFIDQVWTSNDPRPRILPSALRGTFVTPFSWKVPVHSATPVAVTATNLPEGLILEPATLVISGTPHVAGSYETTLIATNASGQHVARIPFEFEPGSTSLAEALDAPGALFTQSAPGTAWIGVTGMGMRGNDSARGFDSQFFLPSVENVLSTTITGPGTLSFWYRCDQSALGIMNDRAVLSFYVGTSPSPGPLTMSLGNDNWSQVKVEVPAGPHAISWKPTRSLIGSSDLLYSYLDDVRFAPLGSSSISVQLRDGAAVPPRSNQFFNDVFVGGTRTLTFTIRNSGSSELTGLATVIDGRDAADFTVTKKPEVSVSGPDGSTSFTVEFSPSSPGAKTAILHVASNDPDDNPFDINIMGTGLELVNRLVDQRSSVTLTVTAAAGASVQWLKDGVEIPGATATTLALSSAQPWHIGLYSSRQTTGNTSTITDVALLGLTGVPSGPWRGLISCYRFDGSAEDSCRPDKPASFKSTSGLESDPQRGGVAHVQGKGFGVPPVAGEPAELQGPGGYIQIPTPPLGEGEPFTVSFIIKEEGFSYWHGESFLTMGEAGATLDLIGHYWIGSLHNTAENYGGPGGPIEPFTSTYVLNGDAVTLDLPWTNYTVVGDRTTLRFYRDGQLMGTGPYTKVPVGAFFIGRHSWADGTNYSTRLVGGVDDLRIFNRALTATEVGELYSLVQTTPPAGSFESWALIHGLTGTDASPSADPDRDDLTNQDEFHLGISPTDGTQLPMQASLIGTNLRIEWLEKTGVLYALKETSDLINPWATSATVPVPSADQAGVPAGYQRMQVALAVPPSGTSALPRFFRVEATKVP